MTKILSSPIARWSGEIILRDVTLPMLIAWRDARDAAFEFTEPSTNPGKVNITDGAKFNAALLVGCLPIIESHTLKGLPAKLLLDNFPGQPILDAILLAQWINNSIDDWIDTAEEVPNE